MYSTNGRKKDKNKEVAKTKTSKVLICDTCGYIEVGRVKEFGEEVVCAKCGDTHVRFE